MRHSNSSAGSGDDAASQASVAGESDRESAASEVSVNVIDKVATFGRTFRMIFSTTCCHLVDL